MGSNTAFYISLATTSAAISSSIVSYYTTVIITNAVSGGFTTATSVTNLHLGTFGSVVFKGDFTDMTGTAGGRTAFTATKPGVCKSKAIFGTGTDANVDMLTKRVITG